jgi:hypothetical protein
MGVPEATIVVEFFAAAAPVMVAALELASGIPGQFRVQALACAFDQQPKG